MIDFNKEYILENDRIILKPLTQEDYSELLEFSINEPEIWKYNAWGAAGKENLLKYIDNATKNRFKEQEYPFVVIDKNTHKKIGSTRFYNISILNQTLEIGYTWYGKNFQGTYVNKNCKYLLLEFAFEKLNIERVGFRANSTNEKSIHAMKSIGCTMEGTLRNFTFDSNGKRINSVVLSILKNEWFDTIKEQLYHKIKNYK